jgi:tetratricopeptide (TPR) repeat protein
MRGAIAWSVALLPDAARTVFARLAVFTGGSDLAAAEAIGAVTSEKPGDLAALEHITHLAEQSLIRIVDYDDAPRVEMLETIREYALELLRDSGEEAVTRSLHARWFLDRATVEKTRFNTAAEADTLDLIERDRDNYRAALAWLTETDPASAVRLAAVLAHLWQVRSQFREAWAALRPVLAVSHHALPLDSALLLLATARIAEAQGDYEAAESRYREALALARAEDATYVVCQALEGLGGMAQDQGRFDEAQQMHQEVLSTSARVGDEQGVAHALLNLGAIAAMRGDVPHARTRLDEALRILRGLGNQYGVAASLTNLGSLAFETGDLSDAKRLWEEALVLWRSINAPSMAAAAMANLGEAAMLSGETERAATYLRQAHDLHLDIGDRHALAIDLAALGYSAVIAGDPISARRHLADALQLAQESRHPRAEAFTVETMAMIAVQEGRAELAARLIGHADAVRNAHDVPIAPVYRSALEQTVATARTMLGDVAFARALASGQLPADAVTSGASTSETTSRS